MKTANIFYDIPGFVSSSRKKIDRFSNLEIGWRFGEGIATKPAVAARARRMIRIAESFGWETDVFPGVGGELLIEADSGKQHYELIFEINGALTLIRTEDGEDVERLENRTDEEAIDRIRFRHYQCATYAYFTQTTGRTRTEDDLADWHFGKVQNHPTEYLSSIRDVRAATAGQCAATSKRITGSGTRPQFSGVSRQTKSVPLDGLCRPLWQDETSGVTTIFTILETKPPSHSSNLTGGITDWKTTKYAVLEDIKS